MLLKLKCICIPCCNIIVLALCRRVAIIKSDKDTRYGLESIVTHDGEKFPCFPLSHLSSFKQRIGPDVYDKVFWC